MNIEKPLHLRMPNGDVYGQLAATFRCNPASPGQWYGTIDGLPGALVALFASDPQRIRWIEGAIEREADFVYLGPLEFFDFLADPGRACFRWSGDLERGVPRPTEPAEEPEIVAVVPQRPEPPGGEVREPAPESENRTEAAVEPPPAEPNRTSRDDL